MFTFCLKFALELTYTYTCLLVVQENRILHAHRISHSSPGEKDPEFQYNFEHKFILYFYPNLIPSH